MIIKRMIVMTVKYNKTQIKSQMNVARWGYKDWTGWDGPNGWDEV